MTVSNEEAAREVAKMIVLHEQKNPPPTRREYFAEEVCSSLNPAYGTKSSIFTLDDNILKFIFATSKLRKAISNLFPISFKHTTRERQNVYRIQFDGVIIFQTNDQTNECARIEVLLKGVFDGQSQSSSSSSSSSGITASSNFDTMNTNGINNNTNTNSSSSSSPPSVRRDVGVCYYYSTYYKAVRVGEGG